MTLPEIPKCRAKLEGVRADWEEKEAAAARDFSAPFTQAAGTAATAGTPSGLVMGAVKAAWAGIPSKTMAGAAGVGAGLTLRAGSAAIGAARAKAD